MSLKNRGGATTLAPVNQELWWINIDPIHLLTPSDPKSPPPSTKMEDGDEEEETFIGSEEKDQ